MLLLLAGAAAAPARATTSIIDGPINGPITVGAGDRVEIHTGGSVWSTTDGIEVNTGGELVIYDGSVSGGGGPGTFGVVVSGGTVTVYGGSVSARNGLAVDSGLATISGGTVSGDAGVRVNGGLVTISGGSISGGIDGMRVHGGTATLAGGTVSGPTGLRVHGATATLSGGSVSGGNAAVLVTGGGTATLSGSSVSGSTGVSVINGGAVTLSGGSVSGNPGLEVTDGTVTISGCNLNLDVTALSGILQDGTVISTHASVTPPGQLILDSAATQITCPANQTVTATSAAGAVVHYLPPTVGNTCGPVQVTSVPASGSTFPVGTTPVKCTVTDALGNSSSCSFTITVLPAAAADLGVFMTAVSGKKSGNPLRVNVGQTLTYTIGVTNNGPQSAENVEVEDLLPAGFVFQSATTSQGTLQTPPSGGTGTLTASLGSLAVGGSATVRITGSFSQRKTTNPNTAKVSAGTTDPNSANNQATVTVIVN